MDASQGSKAQVSPDSFAPAEIHQRYMVQAEWTAELRERISKRLIIEGDQRILEVGSGTGAITGSMAKQYAGRIFGVDIDFPTTAFAHSQDPRSRYAVADGVRLPFCDGAFDAAYSHFLFLWIDDPETLISEMRRVVRSGGWLIAFAEPDYGGRIDYPQSLQEIGMLQLDSLRRQGANPEIGRSLRSMFVGAGLTAVTAGVLGAEWHPQFDDRFISSEWQTLRSDLADRLPAEQLERLQRADQQAWLKQLRILFVPTFYAYGQVR
jgi:ubiquinone/menaquinone biosynthesis C-methylase UbiE